MLRPPRTASSRRPARRYDLRGSAVALTGAAALAAVLRADRPPLPAIQRLEARGRWVTADDGKSPSVDSFHRGLQTSGLVFRNGELWSVGDQRSTFPGHLFRIDCTTGRLLAPPLRVEPPDASSEDESGAFAEYRRIPNSDFEGLTTYPGDTNRLIAVTEDKIPWLAIIALDCPAGEAATTSPSRARLERLVPVRFPSGLVPWRNDTNFRLEGCATDDRTHVLYVCFERARDELPRLYRVDLAGALARDEVEFEELPAPFRTIPRRADKPEARLNLNGIHLVYWKDRALLVAVARDQERVLVLDAERGDVRRIIDLDLRDPDGGAIHWVSPEGLTLDANSGRLFFINDPDSVRGNYKARGAPAASGRFAAFCPLLFELDLAGVLP